MELKLVLPDIARVSLVALLIEPYGIEIRSLIAFILIKYYLLIEPYGIEIMECYSLVFLAVPF